MVSYAPYFISTVVICGMLTIFMNPDTGVFQYDLKSFGYGADGFPLQTEMV